MIDVDEAQRRVLALVRPVEIERVALADAAGRWAIERVIAKRTQPARDLSAMDGYAVRHDDMPGPWRVIDEAAAGAPARSAIAHGEAARIFTGAALPEGCDTVIIQENVTRDGDTVGLVGDPVPRSANVRRAGSDFVESATLIDAGLALTPARIALAAMGGHGILTVRRRVRVALISTGNELVPAGSDPGTDRLPSSNAPMLAAMMAVLPVDITDVGIVRDDLAALTAALADAAATHDIVVTTGGASVGDHDLVRPALIAAGATIDFWKIAMRPGKPLMAGRIGGAVALGLPGNPVSAFVTAILFLKPLIVGAGGAADPLPTRIAARLGEALPAVGVRTDFVRMRWRGGALVSAGQADSGMVFALAQAEALAVRPAGSVAAAAGEIVETILLT